MEENVTRDADGIAVLPAEEPEHVTSLTPSGLEVYYSWAPRRHYKIRYGPETWAGATSILWEWREIPSVTSVLNVLDKSGALSWWSQEVSAEGVCELVRRGRVGMRHTQDAQALTIKETDTWATKESLVDLLVSEHLSINHQRDKAADRGISVHSAFERWSEDTSFRPTPSDYPETEQGYITGLGRFLDDLGEVEDVESEVMVGSIQHGFAGRYDLRLTSSPAFEEKTLVTRIYPKRAAKRGVIPAGKWLIDLKTSKACYASHSMQLAAYELASVECGYGATDYRAVVRVTADGLYEFRRANATADDFLSVLSTHQTMSRKDWF